MHGNCRAIRPAARRLLEKRQIESAHIDSGRYQRRVGNGFFEMIALHTIHTKGGEHEQRLFVLHALRDDGLVHAAGHRNHRLNEQLIVRISRQIADKQSVDLDRIDVQMLEIGERRKPRAKIIQAHAAAGVLQGLDKAARVMQIVFPDLKAMFEAGTRRVNVRISWYEGKKEYGVELEQWITNSKEAGIGANLAGLLETEEEDEEDTPPKEPPKR